MRCASRLVRTLLAVTIAALATAAPVETGPVSQQPPQPVQVVAGGALPRAARFTHLTADDGLSDQAVRDVVQDRDGFMWFGTANGLNRYDGYTFVEFRHNPADPDSIGGNAVNVLYADPDGSLWVGGRGAGLSVFDPRSQRFTRFRHDPGNPFSLSNDSPRSIFQDRLGALWIGTEGGLNRLDNRGLGTFARYMQDPDAVRTRDNFILAITEDRAGTLWVGTAAGLHRLDRQTGAFVAYRHDPADPRSLSRGRVFELLADQLGALWVATDGGGLSRLDNASGNGRFTRFQNDPAIRAA